MLEIATGIVFGVDTSIPEPPRGIGDPRTALERDLIGSLQKPPCGVAFSGGRDSSAVLAVATLVARKHQLPDPIPVTLRFPGVENTDETSYQVSVVRYLGLAEWARLEPGDSLDILGDAATELTQRHGLLYPGNIQFLVPMLDAVRGGALLTGLGGDEVLAGHPNYTLAASLLGRRRPSRRLMRDLAKRYVFRKRRRDQIRTELAGNFPWLVPDARREVIERLVEVQLTDSLLADRHLTSITYRMRYLHRAQTDMATVAADFEVTASHPLLGAEFVGAIADRAGRVGRPSRTEAMEDLFGDALPPEIIQRTSKALFDDVFWTHMTSEQVETLSLGPLADHIDGPALREVWRSDAVKGNTYLIAKYLWELKASGAPKDADEAT
jgi:asparagine synthase (glutamine-hydrolysing)